MTLGISGFGALASVALYRPYFLGLTALSLGYSYLLTYRKRVREIRSGGGRYRPDRHELILWATTVLVILLALFPYYNPVALP